jgi:hypothetical protein
MSPWPLRQRRRSRPLIRQAIAAHASQAIAAYASRAGLHVLRAPRAVRRFVAQIAADVPDTPAA